MSVSRTALRLIALLFFLAGVLLLRRPVFGHASTAAPTRILSLKNLSIPGQPSPIVDTSSSARSGTHTYRLTEHTIRAQRIWQCNCNCTSIDQPIQRGT